VDDADFFGIEQFGAKWSGHWNVSYAKKLTRSAQLVK
jgi:hypothetical protein